MWTTAELWGFRGGLVLAFFAWGHHAFPDILEANMQSWRTMKNMMSVSLAIGFGMLVGGSFLMFQAVESHQAQNPSASQGPEHSYSDVLIANKRSRRNILRVLAVAAVGAVFLSPALDTANVAVKEVVSANDIKRTAERRGRLGKSVFSDSNDAFFDTLVVVVGTLTYISATDDI